MHNFTIYVDSDPLPEYVERNDHLGVIVASVLDGPPRGRLASRQELWSDTRSLARPWRWKPIEFVLVEVRAHGQKVVAKASTRTVVRVLPDRAGEAAAHAWINGRTDHYWALAHSGGLSLLMTLRWPDSRDDLVPMQKAAAALELLPRLGAKLEELREGDFTESDRKRARLVLDDILKRLQEDLPAGSLDDLRRSADSPAFAANLRRALEAIMLDENDTAATERLRACAYYKFGRDGQGAGAETETPRTLLGFLGNLTGVMAPVPQHAQLSHIVRIARGDQAADGVLFVALVPLVAFDVEGNKVEVSRAMIEAALDEWSDVEGVQRQLEDVQRKLLWLTVPLGGEDGPRLTLESTMISAPLPETPKSAVHEGLWAEVELRQGLRARHARADISTCLDLLDPLLGCLEEYAVVPEPVEAFRRAAGLLRDLALPGADCVRRVAVALELSDELLGKWKTERERLKRSPAWFAALLGFSPEVKAALTPWTSETTTRGDRTLAARAEVGSPQVWVSLSHVKNGDSGEWTVGSARLVVDAASVAGATYELRRWDGSRWQPWGSANGSDAKRIELPVPGWVRAGRHQLLCTVGGTKQIVARFVLPADEDGLAPVRSLITTFHRPETHAALVLGLLRGGWAGAPEPGQLGETIVKLASRPVIRGENLRAVIIAALCDAKDIGDPAGQVVDRAWKDDPDAEEPMPAAGPGDDEFAQVRESLKERARQAFARIEHEREMDAPGALPLEITLAAAVKDSPEYDDDTKPAVDPLARLAGAAVLLRFDAQWRCINAARLALRPGAEVVGVVGLPVGYEDGVATMSVAYEGMPVAVHPPTTDPDGHVAGTEAPDDAFEVASYEFVEWTQQEPPPEWTRPPRLVHGRSYEAAGFFVHQSGALPKEIAEPDAPWSLRRDLPDKFPGIKARTYVRTTPIGAPRFEQVVAGKDGQKRRADLGTEIPEGVHPLARELPRVSVLHRGPARRFFQSGRRGELDLTGGAWTLTLEGVEARGFDLAENIDVRVTLASGVKDGVAEGRAIVIRRKGASLTVLLAEQVAASFTIAAECPASVVLRCTPTDRPDQTVDYRLVVTAWPADELPPGPPEDVSFRGLAEYCVKDRFLEVSVSGTATDASSASVSFGVPRVETSVGVFAAAAADEAPVLLLARSRQTTDDSVPPDLALRPRAPAVDIDCWERSIPPGKPALLADVRAGWQVGVERNQEAKSPHRAPPIDLGLDDPAVTHLLMAVVPVFARADSRAVVSSPLPLAAPRAADPELAAAKHFSDRYINEVLLREAVRPPVSKNIVPVRVDGQAPEPRIKSGEVWEVLVWPLVPKAQQGVLSATVSSQLVAFSADYVAGPPSRLLVETISDELPRFEEMRAALTASVEGRAIAVTFEPGAIAAKIGRDDSWGWRGHRFASVRDAALARQRWRWSGRPIAPYPSHKDKSFMSRPAIEELPRKFDAEAYATYRAGELKRIAEILKWEVEGFGDRDQADYLTTSHVLKPFVVTDLRREELAGDGRAQHWRFRLVARSRYAAILPAGKREVSAPVGTKTEPVPVQDLWTRAFVPAVLPAELKPPSVRLVVPLTQRREDQADPAAAPPLLVVLDDPWFDIGGLAEDFSVAVVTAGTLQEFGPDPLRTAAGEPRRVQAERRGPIGYTYDSGASAQRFAHSSFIVDLRPEEHGPVPDWSFVKLTFQRKLVRLALAGKPETPTIVTLMESASTPGLWCQLAADFSRFALAGGGVVFADELLVDREALLQGGTKGPAFVRKVDGKAVALTPYQAPVPESKLRVALWVVATARIVDASDSVVERYFGVYKLDGERLKPADGGPAIDASADLRLVFRVIEVESRATAVEPGFERLWPPAGEWDATRAADAAARIVKVSRPIGYRS